MKVLVFDNYDSFTYNIVHAMRDLNVDCTVVRNDKINLEEIEYYDKIVISPGPGIPEEAGLLMSMLEMYSGRKSILGVCLGHQAIGQHFGCKLLNLPEVYHGISSDIKLENDDYLFAGLSKKITVGRYHSWVVDNKDFNSEDLEILATDDKGMIMALRHKKFDIRGVQFHPESILTPDGLKIIENWVKRN